MDEDNLRNWGYYEPPAPMKGQIGLNLMQSMAERDTKPSFLTGRDHPVMVSTNGAFHPRDCVVTEPPLTRMEYVREDWINHRGKLMQIFSNNHYNPNLAESSGSHHVPMQMIQQPEPTEEARPVMEDPPVKKEPGTTKKLQSSKAPKGKKPRKGPAKENSSGNPSVQRAKPAKKNIEVVIDGVDMDITGIPIPVCSCTGQPQQCYRWGCGGWQSACCTTTISMYPLPMSTKRRGARIAGRKMSQGAFKKVLEKLAGEGYIFANPIDLKSFWAKHGTNKFVVIR